MASIDDPTIVVFDDDDSFAVGKLGVQGYPTESIRYSHKLWTVESAVSDYHVRRMATVWETSTVGTDNESWDVT